MMTSLDNHERYKKCLGYRESNELRGHLADNLYTIDSGIVKSRVYKILLNL